MAWNEAAAAMAAAATTDVSQYFIESLRQPTTLLASWRVAETFGRSPGRPFGVREYIPVRMPRVYKVPFGRTIRRTAVGNVVSMEGRSHGFVDQRRGDPRSRLSAQADTTVVPLRPDDPVPGFSRLVGCVGFAMELRSPGP